MEKQSNFSNVPNVGVKGLRALVAVADHGSFRQAAARLGYTQSAVSHQVVELERALGSRLFTRPGGRGQVALTATGELAYVHARRALSEVRALEVGVLAAREEQTAVVRVGVFQTAAGELLPAALEVLRDEWPRVEVVLSEAEDDDALVTKLSEGKLDLAISINQHPDDRIELIRLFEDRWVILTRRDSALAQASEPSFELLDGIDTIGFTLGWKMQVDLEEAWRRRGIVPRFVYRTDDGLVLQRLVAAGLGCACIGHLAARHAIDPALTFVEPADDLVPRTVALCYPRQRHLPAAAHSLGAALRKQFQR